MKSINSDRDTKIVESKKSIRTLAQQIKTISTEKFFEGLRILGTSSDDTAIIPKNFHKKAFENTSRYKQD